MLIFICDNTLIILLDFVLLHDGDGGLFKSLVWVIFTSAVFFRLLGVAAAIAGNGLDSWSVPLKARELKIWLLESFGSILMIKWDCKNIKNFQSYAEISKFDPPSWINPPFLVYLTKYKFGLCCWSQKIECKNVAKSQNVAPLIFGCLLGLQTRTKTFLLWNIIRSKYKPKTKNNSKFNEFWSKNHLSAILKSPPFENISKLLY
jgi:hypothetical protein